MHLPRRPLVVLCTLLVACGDTAPSDANAARAERLQSLLATLAADSMEGRRTGTPGAHHSNAIHDCDIGGLALGSVFDTGVQVINWGGVSVECSH